MAMGVPKTTQMFVRTISHQPLKGGPTFSREGGGTIPTEINRTSIFRERGSGPSAPLWIRACAL